MITSTEPIFNRCGTAIVNVSAVDSDPPTLIPALAGRVVVLATNTNTNPGTGPYLALSPDFQQGDEFWLYATQELSWNINDEFGNLLLFEGQKQGYIKIANGDGTPSNWLPI
jgi:hypothetical protein